MSKLVISSPALENAVKEKFSTHTPERRFGRSSLNELRPARYGDEYTGYFKIVPKGINETGGAVFEIINGHDLESDFCGYTDIRGAEEVRKIQITVEQNKTAEIYFHACGTPGNYNTVIATSTDGIDGSFDTVLIGRINASGKIEQILQTHDPLPYKKDWYL